MNAAANLEKTVFVEGIFVWLAGFLNAAIKTCARASNENIVGDSVVVSEIKNVAATDGNISLGKFYTLLRKGDFFGHGT